MSKFFIHRPIVAMVISIVMVLAGAVALARLPIAQFPDIVPPIIQVTATYTGADALTIEQSVATPIEQQVNGADNMLYVQSTNANDGTMNMSVTFDVGTDVNINQVNVQNRLAQAAPNLPAAVNQFGVTVRKSTGFPLLVVALVSPKGTYDNKFLGNYMTINVIDSLLRVPGVGQVTNFSPEYALRIWVKPDRLAKLGLTVGDVASALQQQSAVNPAGQIGGEPAPPEQEMTYAVRAQGRLVEPEEFEAIVLRAAPDGATVRLKDVARVELGTLGYGTKQRVNGVASGVMAVYQIPGSNALAVANGVKAQLEELKKRFPGDVDYLVSLDTTLPITEGMREIVKTLVEALFLVILVVYLFLQSWRATLIPLVAVPVSLVGTFAVFPLLGFSINTLSLFGLVLAIGLVVDDAIVVVEAVQRHIEGGKNPKEAALLAMEDVAGPVVGIALILAAVFIPVALIGGTQGRLNTQFAVTIAVSVLISAFNALTLSPALAALILKPPKEEKGLLARFFRGFNRGFGKATDGYVKWSGHLVRKAVISVLLLVAVSAGVGWLGKTLPSGFVPDEDQGYMFLNVQLPDAASLQRTDAVCRKIEEIAGKTDGIATVTTVAGFSLLTRTSAPYTGFFFVALAPWSERREPHQTAKAIAAKLNMEFGRQIPEAIAFAFLPPAIPGVGISGGFTFELQDRSGGDLAYLETNLNRFLEAARKRPELGGLNSAWSATVPQLYVDVDKEKALKQGVAVGDVYQTLQANLGGAFINQFNRFGRQWRVFVQAESQYRLKPEDIGQFYVRSASGRMAPLGTLATVRQISGPEYTQRFNLFRSVEILGSAAAGYSSGQAVAALEQVAAEVLPAGMGYDWSGLSYQEKKSSGQAGPIFALSIVCVFLILAALYESWSLPFSVLLTTPVAILGAFLGLKMRAFDFDIYGQIGMIMLVGLAAKNAILIVEFAKVRFDRGEPLVESALDGARLRLRPILMTSFAFILGCVPLWIAAGAGAGGRQILGTTVISGMLTATVFGIFLVPVLFVVVERLASGRKVHAAVVVEPGRGDD